MNPARGPTPEEYAEFEQASRPRRQPIQSSHILRLATAATVIFLAATLVIAAMHWFSDNSSDHLVLGTWRSSDHPQFAKLQVGKGGFIIMTDKAGRISNAHFRFLAQYTIELFLFDKSEPLHTWKLKLDREEMTTTDMAGGVTSHWRRG